MLSYCCLSVSLFIIKEIIIKGKTVVGLVHVHSLFPLDEARLNKVNNNVLRYKRLHLVYTKKVKPMFY